MGATKPSPRLIRVLMLGLATIVILGCGDATKGTLKGILLKSDGSPLGLNPGDQAFLSFAKLDASGSASMEATYPASLDQEGRYEVIASGGELPVGKYRVTLTIMASSGETKQGRPKQADRLKGKMNDKSSTLTIEIQAGANDLPIKLPAGLP